MAGVASIAQIPESEENFKKLTDFLPPSPNAASIIKEGELSANGNNGVASFNIGLLGLSAKNLAVSVGITYSATGIKVDDIAGRVGMGWSLQAGGVITRTLRGKPDEFNTRRGPWATITTSWPTFNFFSSIAETPQTSSYDSEPDLFNFNVEGISGSFVIGDTGQIVQNKETGIIIIPNFSSSAWNFKIITTDGNIYYFGGTGAKELSKRTSICGKTFDQFWATAWYLKKMEEPNGNSISFEYDEINFDYETGVSQSASTGIIAQTMCGNTPCPGTSYSDCANANYVQGVLLTTIVKDSDGSRINFTYTDREDCDDKLLSWVEVVNSTDKTIKRYQLLYDEIVGQSYNGHEPGETDVTVTPYLKELRLWDSSSTTYQSHKFQYNDPESRPQRLAYSQDYWGFFNGINNTTLIPTPVTPYERQQLSLANADRSVNFNYAAKGILNKIQYPTGAVDSIVYEPNIFAGTGLASIHQADCQSTGTGFSTQVMKSIPFTGKAITLEMVCTDNSGTGSFDSIHNKGTVEVTTAAGTLLYSKLFSPGQSLTINFEEEAININDTAQLYVKLYANGSVVTTWARITFHPNTGSEPQQDLVGGLRVKSIFTNDGLGNIDSKLYQYHSLIDSMTSSLLWYPQPINFRKEHKNLSIFTCLGESPYPSTVADECSRITYSSSTQGDLFNYAGNPVSYNYVIESADYHHSTGATETKYGVLANAQGWHIWGEENLIQPINNVSNLMNGLELEKIIYRKNTTTNDLEPISKTNSTYQLYNLQSVFGYQIQKRTNSSPGTPTDTVTVNPPSVLCDNNNLNCQLKMFNVSKYEFVSATVGLQSQQQTQYSQTNTDSALVVNTTNYYDTDQPWLLTKSETQSSTRQATDTRYTYPKDHTDQTIYQQMVAQNKTAGPVSVGGYLRNDQQYLTKINYANWGNNNLMPDSITRSILESNFDVEGTITQRDSKGNILELIGRDGVVKSFIWGYQKEYPVAAITGANYSTATAQLTVSLSTLETLDGTALLTETNKIRTGLSNAFVTTYTYIPLIGLKSETNANNRKTTYEYDAFNRLSAIRDHDSNIVKSITYNYNGTRDSLLASNAKIYFNQTTSSNFICQNCLPGYTGDSVTYTVPAGAYFSKTSQADANTLAQHEVNARGQQNANLKGLCKNVYSASCGSPDKKRINCVCETGTKVYLTSTQTGPNSYTCTFYYRWSDDSQSSVYSETSSVPCALGGGIED